MGTFKLYLTDGTVKYFTTPTTGGDLSNTEVANKACDAGIIPYPSSLQDSEHWPAFDKETTKPCTFHLMGRMEIANGVSLEQDRAGNPVFEHPNGNKYRVVVSLEEISNTGDTREPDSNELEDLGFICFGELDQQDIRITEDEG